MLCKLYVCHTVGEEPDIGLSGSGKEDFIRQRVVASPAVWLAVWQLKPLTASVFDHGAVVGVRAAAGVPTVVVICPDNLRPTARSDRSCDVGDGCLHSIVVVLDLGDMICSAKRKKRRNRNREAAVVPRESKNHHCRTMAGRLE